MWICSHASISNLSNLLFLCGAKTVQQAGLCSIAFGYHSPSIQDRLALPKRERLCVLRFSCLRQNSAAWRKLPYLLTYLFMVASGLSCGMLDLHCGTWDL